MLKWSIGGCPDALRAPAAGCLRYGFVWRDDLTRGSAQIKTCRCASGQERVLCPRVGVFGSYQGFKRRPRSGLEKTRFREGSLHGSRLDVPFMQDRDGESGRRRNAKAIRMPTMPQAVRSLVLLFRVPGSPSAFWFTLKSLESKPERPHSGQSGARNKRT